MKAGTRPAAFLGAMTLVAVIVSLVIPLSPVGRAASADGALPRLSRLPYVTHGETCPDLPYVEFALHWKIDGDDSGGFTLGPGPAVPEAEPPPPLLSADRLIPGTPALITVNGRNMPEGWIPVVTDPQGPVKMYRHGDIWRGYAAAGYRLAAGDYKVTAVWCHPGLRVKAFESSVTINVPERVYTLSRIWVTEDVAATRTPELLQEDRRWTEAARAASHPRSLWSGPFILPLDSRRTTGFGHIRYVNGVESGRHTGIDIAAPLGTPVVAAHHGRVVLARMLNAGGNTVILDHGLNLNTSYLHLNEIAVDRGQWVRQGDVIGYVGTTGFSTGPHLHWGAHIGAHPIDADTLLLLAGVDAVSDPTENEPDISPAPHPSAKPLDPFPRNANLPRRRQPVP